ncbi:pickpocket protein 11-like [Macrosteles quadrilineatus]|uniref:pickpocket protein 11-like n=1 Tax=Macrosteles quadrilineatus TaxID=74068 RepID=UPI0023E18A98|nr:pickpocket protein 11-like [Macrosteles quadrilineatus]
MSVSQFAKDAALHFSVNFPVQVFIHDVKEVMFLNSKAPVLDPDSSLRLLYSVRETVVDISARELSTEQRGCVVEGERSVQGYPVYSRSSCQTACLAQHQLSVCGCHHHLLPTPDNSRYCDLKGLQCIDDDFRNKNQTKTRKRSNMYKKCECLQSCDQQEVKVIWGRLKRNESDATIHIQLAAPPTERLVLKSRVNFLDILVGFACFTRLFTSISLLDVILLLFTWMYPRKGMFQTQHGVR